MNLRARPKLFGRRTTKAKVDECRCRSTFVSREDAILYAILSVAGFFAIIFNLARFFGF